MNSNSISNQDIETSTCKDSDHKSQHSKFLFRLNTILGHLKPYLIKSCEPHLWQEYSSTGSLCWCAYDPQTQQSVYGLTEAEMRRWLEQLLY